MRGHRRFRATAIGVIAIAAVLAAGVAVAQHARGGGVWATAESAGQSRGSEIAKLLKTALAKLALTDEQKTQIQAVIASETPILEGLAQQRKTDAQALHDAANAAQPDPAAVGAAFLKVRADGLALRDEVDKLIQGIEALLTPEQRAAFQAYLDAFRTLRRGRNF